jgi:hypothetical protein
VSPSPPVFKEEMDFLVRVNVGGETELCCDNHPRFCSPTHRWGMAMEKIAHSAVSGGPCPKCFNQHAIQNAGLDHLTWILIRYMTLFKFTSLKIASSNIYSQK